MQLSLKIVTPERIVYQDTVDSVSVMTYMGEVTILPNHIPLMSNLRSGEVRLKKNGETSHLVASTGFLEVRSHNEVVILADTAERAEELELEKIEEAKERARKFLTETRHQDHVALADATVHLERELARYHVAVKHKRSHRSS